MLASGSWLPPDFHSVAFGLNTCLVSNTESQAWEELIIV